jgi:hypothetical protein
MARTLLFKRENGRKFFRFQQSVGFAKTVVQITQPSVCDLWRGELPKQRDHRVF